ncbi:MAG: DUF6152 family protein [Pseudomonadota bacterium]
MAKIRSLVFAAMSITGFSELSFAHHSYADYERDERYEFTGTVTDIFWGNPHILFDVSNGTEVMRIEWVTTAGADKTGVAQQQIEAGDQLTVIGSRNRNPDVHTMTVIKELSMPAKNWQWISPSVGGKQL